MWIKPFPLAGLDSSQENPSIEITLDHYINEQLEEIPEQQFAQDKPSQINDSNEALNTESNTETSTPETKVIEANLPPELNDNEISFNESSSNVLSPQILSRSISNYLSNNRAQLNRESLEECLRYQNRHGTKDCPQINPENFSRLPQITLRSSNNRQRNNKDSLNQLENLRNLMDQNPVISGLASSQYYFERDQYISLNGDNTSTLGSTMNNAIAGDVVLNILSTGGGSLYSYLKGSSSMSLEFSNSSSTEPENYVEQNNGNNLTENFEVRTPFLLGR